jgi:hypothetical protein
LDFRGAAGVRVRREIIATSTALSSDTVTVGGARPPAKAGEPPIHVFLEVSTASRGWCVAGVS